MAESRNIGIMEEWAQEKGKKWSDGTRKHGCWNSEAMEWWL